MRAIENLTQRDSRKFAAVCSDLLSQGFRVRFRAHGKSMQPNIVEDDALLVAPASLATLRRGDVVLTQDDLGLKAHRVVQMNSVSGELLTRGDSGQENDQPAHTSLGKVIAVERNGQTKSLESFSAHFTAKSNSFLHRAKLAFWNRIARVVSYLFPAALLLIFCLLANVSPAAAQANLTVTETPSSGTVSPGGNITYTIVVTNNGPNTAAVPKWVQATPTNTTFVSVTAATGWTCTNPVVGGTGNVTCTDGVNLTTGAGAALRTFTLVVKVNAGTAGTTVISGSVTVSSTTTDPTPGNNTGTSSVTVNSADLAITETPGSASASPGGTISYTVVVTNNGASPAAAPSWSQVTPTNTTFASVTPPAGWTCTKPAVGATGTCHLH